MVSCPNCGEHNLVQKKSILYEESLFGIKFASMTTDINCDFKSNINVNLSSSEGSAVMQNYSGIQFRPPIKPEEPKREIVQFSFIGGAIGFFISGWIISEINISSNSLSLLIYLAYVIIGVKISVYKRNKSFIKECNSYQSRLEMWKKKYDKWSRTYRCRHCGWEFIPGEEYINATICDPENK